MMVRLGLCLIASVAPLTAVAQPYLMLQPPPMSPSRTPLEVAASSFSLCVSREIRALPASLGTDEGQAQVLANCGARLAAVEREAAEIILESRLSPDRKARSLQGLRDRIALPGNRVGDRIERRRRAAQTS